MLAEIADGSDWMQAHKEFIRPLMPLESFDGSLSVRVYHVLKDAILSLSYKPGEILRKSAICAAFWLIALTVFRGLRLTRRLRPAVELD